jgi:GAF domain-containing protein
MNKSLTEIEAAIHDPARLAEVEASGLLDTAAEEIFDELTREASRRLGAPLAMLTVVDEYRDYVKSHVGLPEPYATNRELIDTPTSCQLTIAQGEPVVINDTSRAPLYDIFPSVRHSGVRAHMGIPLTLNGQPVGNCCVIDFRPREWTDEDLAVLIELAEKAMALLQARVRPVVGKD